MKRRAWLWLLLVLPLAGAGGNAPVSPAIIHLQHCLVSLIQDVKVPGQEAGVLVDVTVHEGDRVERDMVLGRINDAPSKLQRRVAISDRQVTAAKAESDVKARFAAAAHKAADFEYRANVDANKRLPGTRPVVDIEKLQMAVDQATLQIEEARHDQKIAALETEGNQAKVELAEDDIRRREIRAPLNGEVVEVLIQQGEWVQPGDAVLRVIRMDRLRVEGYLNVAKALPSEVVGRPVEVVATLARERTELFTGKIVFVDPRVQAGGDYRFWVEVENRKTNEHWLLRPGLDVSLTINLE